MTMIQGEDGPYPAWIDDFEARYPDGATDIDLLQEFVSWVKSTDGNPAKFKQELAQWCDVQDSIFYYVFTLTFLMVDSWAKNTFPTRFASDGKWYWLPYDFDTALGINNEGQLTFGYSLEDTDVIGVDTLVFNGQNSVFWTNLRTAYANEIQSMYSTLRSGGNFSYETVRDRFVNHQSKWPAVIKNADAIFKYIEPYTGPQRDASYLPMLLGDKKSQRDWWLYNRFRYLDSKFKCGENMADGNVINIRAYASGDMTFTSYADIYMTVVMGAASKPMSFRATRNVPVRIPCTLDNVNDLEMAFGAAQALTSIGDLAPLKIGYANFAAGIKLESIKVGDKSSSYVNENLQAISFGNNKLLKSIDCRNCINLGKGTQSSIDLSNCTAIEEVYMDNTSIASVVLPNGGSLRRLHLPSTVSNLTILNQRAIVEFQMPSYANVSTLRLENVSNIINPIALLDHIQPHARIRIIGFDVSVNNADEVFEITDKLDTFRGLDETGNNLEYAQVQGIIRVPEISQTRILQLKERYPYLQIIADNVICYVTYKTEDGSQTIGTEIVPLGGSCTVPFDTSKFVKPQTEDYTYTYDGWSKEVGGSRSVNYLLNIKEDVTLYQYFSRSARLYEIKFMNGAECLGIQNVRYGSSAQLPTSMPVNFDMWIPNPKRVYGPYTYYASIKAQTGSGEISDSWETIISKIQAGNHRSYKVGQTKSFSVNGHTYHMQLVGLDRDLNATHTGFNRTSWLLKEVYETFYEYNPKLVEHYESVPMGTSWAYDEDEGCYKSLNKGIDYSEATCVWKVNSLADGTLTLEYKVSCERVNDYLSIWVDGELICNKLSGSQPWVQYTKNFMSGQTVTVKATYFKDASRGDYDDRAYIRLYAGSQSYIDAVPETMFTRGKLIQADPGTGSIDGWTGSSLRTICNTDIFNALPVSVRGAIVSTSKYVEIMDSKKGHWYRYAVDKIWMPTTRDVSNVDGAMANYHEIFDNSLDARVKYRYGFTDNGCQYWTMDVYNSQNPESFVVVGYNGAMIPVTTTHRNTGVVFGFCI